MNRAGSLLPILPGTTISLQKSRWHLSLLLVFGAALGISGIRWGLPSARRLRAFPTGRPDARTAERLEASWRAMYRGIEAAHEGMHPEEPPTYLHEFVRVDAGWRFPPPALLNSYRSMILHSANPDEKKSFIILSRMRPKEFDFKPLYIQYGGAFIYPLGAFLKLSSLLGAFHAGNLSHFLQHPEDMANAYLCGRIFILIAHLATLALLFECGFLLAGSGVGLWAALLYAVCPAVIDNIHILKPHPYSALWTTTSILFALRAQKSGVRRDYLGCGAAAGMAAGSSLILAPLVALPLLPRWERRPAAGKTETRSALLGTAVAMLIGAGTNPYLILHPSSFAWETQIYSHQTFALDVAHLPGLARNLIAGMGAPLAILCCAAWLLACGQRGPRRLLAAASGALFTALWLRFHDSTEEFGGLRIFLSLFPMATLLASDALRRLSAPTQTLILALAVGAAGVRSAAILQALRADSGPESTRERAALWIEDHIPPKATIGMLRYPEPEYTPPFRLDRYTLLLFDHLRSLPANVEPEYLITDPQSRGELGSWLRGRYDLAAEFLPPRVGWASISEDSFIDRRIFIFKIRARSFMDAPIKKQI